jgi:hypothetical protein
VEKVTAKKIDPTPRTPLDVKKLGMAMRVLKKLFIVSLVTSLVFSFPWVALAKEQDTLDELASTVVFLQNEVVDKITKQGKEFEVWLKPVGSENYVPKTHSVSGTGFLVARGESEVFLVTAAHVAASMDCNATVTFRGELNKPISLPLLQLSGQSGSPNWIKHNTADVACLKLTPVREVKAILRRHFLPISFLASDDSAPSRDIKLTVLGFPLGLGIVGQFSPISQESFAASGLLELKPSESEQAGNYFLLQDPSVGGFSGAPVFDRGGASFSGRAIWFRGGGPKVVGLVKGTISDNTGGKFAAIVPSKYILETMNLSK